MEFVYVVVKTNGAEEMSIEELNNKYVVSDYIERPRLREELQGQPIIDDLCGPMYDGKNENGAVRIRYEDWEVYDLLSR